jgi:hypothetical protein
MKLVLAAVVALLAVSIHAGEIGSFSMDHTGRIVGG